MNFDLAIWIEDFVTAIASWLDKNLQTFFTIIIIITAAIIAKKLVSEIFGKVLNRTVRDDMFPSKVDRDRRFSTLNGIVSAIISFIIWAVAILMILNLLGVNTAPILASAGIIGVALGFGAQSLVRDFMTGMFIIAENQYRVGDYVEIQNVKGVVKAVTIRTTIVKDDDGNIFHIPNGSIVVTSNKTMSNNKIGFEISVNTNSDLDKLETVVNGVGKAQMTNEKIKEFISEPLHFERIKDISGGSIIVRISGKVRSGGKSEVKSDFFIALQKELKRLKIEFK